MNSPALFKPEVNIQLQLNLSVQHLHVPGSQAHMWQLRIQRRINGFPPVTAPQTPSVSESTMHGKDAAASFVAKCNKAKLLTDL